MTSPPDATLILHRRPVGPGGSGLAAARALAAAAEGGDGVVAVFCFERGLARGRHGSQNRNAYLLASLRELDDGLRAAGSRLHYRHGDPAREIPRLAAEIGAARVHVNRDHTVHSLRRDRAVEAELAGVLGHLERHPAEV